MQYKLIFRHTVNYILDFIIDRSKVLKDIEKLTVEETLTYLNASKPKQKYGVNYLFNYKDQRIKDLIWQLKFNENKLPAKIFGYAISKHMPKDYILVPIPIHRKRKSERGYNQCEWICEEVTKHIQIQYIPNLLLRKKYAEKQSWNDRSTRKENIKDSFILNTKYDIKDKNIILIDDVLTTGATIKEAHQTLKKSGAKNIICYTIAH